jgi:hypothetical protein
MANRFDLMGLLVGTQTDEDYCKKPVIVQGMTGSLAKAGKNLMASLYTTI